MTIDLVLRHPRTVLAAYLAVTALGLVATARLPLDSDVSSMLPADHPAIVFERAFSERFHARDPVVVGYETTRPDGVLGREALVALFELERAAGTLDVLERGSVMGPFALGRARSPGGDAVFARAPDDDEAAGRIRETIEGDRAWFGDLVAADGRTALVAANLERGADPDRARAALESLRAGLDPRDSMFLAGIPIVTAEIDRAMHRDVARLVPAAMAAILVILVAFFRSTRGVLVPLAVVASSTVWALGAMSLAGESLHAMSSMLPTVLLAVGTAQALHVMTFHRRALAAGLEGRTAVRDTMRDLARPLWLTAITTAIGFGSLATSAMGPIRAFGLYTALGVLSSALLCFTAVPAWLVLFPSAGTTAAPATGLGARQRPAAGPGAAWLARLGAWTSVHARLVVGVVGVLVLVLLPGVWRLEVDADVVKNLDPESDVPRAQRILDAEFGGSTLLNVVLETSTERGFAVPELLGEIAGLEARLRAMPEVGATMSLVGVLERARTVLVGSPTGGDPRAPSGPPTSAGEVSKLLAALRFAGQRDHLARVVTSDLRAANVEVRLRDGSTQGIGRVMAAVEEHLARRLEPLGVTGRIGGTAHVIHEMIGLLVQSQLLSLVLSLAGVWAISAWVFRSPVAGALCALPIVVATWGCFGTMGYTGTPLDPATVILAGIGIGVGIDYTIHFLHRYQRCWDGDAGSHARAAGLAMQSTGVAIALNAGVVTAGFAILAGSSFPPIASLGRLVSLAMVSSFLGAVTLLPAALTLVDPAFLGRRGR